MLKKKLIPISITAVVLAGSISSANATGVAIGYTHVTQEFKVSHSGKEYSAEADNSGVFILHHPD